MIGKLIRNKAKSAKASAAKYENRDLMEAVVGGSLLISAADGHISDEELESLEKLIGANEKLSHFGEEIHKTIEKFSAKLSAGFRLGKIHIMREIADIDADDEGKEDAFVTMYEVAAADGEIDSDEEAMLTEIGKKMGINLKEFGLA